jgi:4-azaleucine resistance transporter AzlC
MLSRRTLFLAGARAELPILLGVMPSGLIYGVLAVAAGLPVSVALAMSVIVFAGSSQFVGVQLMSAGAPGVVIVLTTFVVNLRHALYSISVAPYLKPLRAPWKWLLGYLLTDEAYAVAILRYRDSGREPAGHWYFLGAGLALWCTWQLSTWVGVFVGAQIPAGWGLEFTLALTFIALVVPALKGRAEIVAALVAGTAAVAAYGLPYKLGLIAAAFAGIAAGIAAERATGEAAR